MKETEDDTKKWKDTPCLYCPKQSADLMQSLSKYTLYFHRTRTNKICVEPQMTLHSNPEKEEQSWRHHAP